MSKSNKTVFSSTVFDLPKKRNNNDFIDFITTEYEKFAIVIRDFKGDIEKELDPRLPLIEDQIRYILEAINSYYNGFPAEAYKKISVALNVLVKNKLLPIQTIPVTDGRSNFYRMRVSENKTLPKSELFHIPFQLREKVSTQRYSIPGLPCLYLGDSIFVCWEELGRPSFDTIHVARFDLSTSNLKFLYFNLSVIDLRERCFTKSNDGKFINQLVQFLCYWPILTACSMIVEKPLEVFKPEYIVPQLLLQWMVKSKKVDGIQYKSNRINVSNHNLGTFTNVVIPIKESSQTGLCPVLMGAVKITNVISWQLLDIADPKDDRHKLKADIELSDLRRAMYIELINGEPSDYLNTKFGILEEKLKSLTAEYIVV